MMPPLNTDLMKHPPDKRRPLTAHEREAIRQQREVRRAAMLGLLDTVRSATAYVGRTIRRDIVRNPQRTSVQT